MKRNKPRFAAVVNCVVGRQSIDKRRIIVGTHGDPRFVFSLTSWAEHKKLPSLNFHFKRNLVKVRHAFESSKTIVNLRVRESFDSLRAKLFHIKRSHHRPEDHGSSHRAFVQLLLAGEVTHKTSGKRVACASRIKHCFERISRNREIAVARKQRRAVFAALDDQCSWSPAQQLARSLDEIWDAR